MRNLQTIPFHGDHIITDPDTTLHGQQLQQLQLLHAAKGLISDDYLEARAKAVLNNPTNTTPPHKPLGIQEYLREKMDHQDIPQLLTPTFGKHVKKLYIQENGEAPTVAFKTVNNRRFKTCAYTEADRPLFDRVWETYYASSVEGC